METKLYTPLLGILLFVSTASAQTNFSAQFEPVHQELVKWDPVRGEWLSQSMTAMAQNQRTPDRMFPEDYTPSEMYASMPSETRANVARLATSNQPASGQSTEWSRVNSFISRTGCQAVQARSYGDPHLSSFDGATYSFQTVGEFLLVKSASENMEIQVRQRPQSESISLNTATAMMVAGDRVAFYANELPDANSSTRIRLNGEALYLDRSTYYLPHGGVIRQESEKNYRVVWPTGESAKLAMHSGSPGYIDLTVEVFPCSDHYTGILGNANGVRDDDFDTRGTASRPAGWVYHDFGSSQVSNEAEKEYLAWLSRDFAASWRVTNETTLFDYGFNENTMTFTDPTFPRVHYTVNDLASADRDRARRACQAAGITGPDLAGCIYDGGYVNIPPTPRAPISNPNPGRILNPIRKPEPNVNTGGTVTSSPIPAIRRQQPAPVVNTTNTSGNSNGALPIDKPTVSGMKNTSQPVVKQTHPISSPSPGTTAPVSKTPETSGNNNPAPVVTNSSTPSVSSSAPVISHPSSSSSTPVSLPSSRPVISEPKHTVTPSVAAPVSAPSKVSTPIRAPVMRKP